MSAGALYALLPYNAILNPQAKLAFAETGCAALLPLIFFAVDIGRGQAIKTIVAVAAATALLALMHIPGTVVGGTMVCVYATLLGGSWQKAFRSGACTVTGVVLGLFLVSFNLLPAFDLMPEITQSAMLQDQVSPERNFLMQFGSPWSDYVKLMNFSLVLPVGLVVAVTWSLNWRDTRVVAIAGVLATAVFMTMRVSEPAWLLPPLRFVGFPGRYLTAVSLAASALLGAALARSRMVRHTIIAMACLLFAISSAIAIWRGDNMRSGAVRTEEVITGPGADASEYMPARASDRGWFHFEQSGGNMQARAAAFVSSCIDRGSPGLDVNAVRLGGPLEYNVIACSGLTVFPQFYFPGWVATIGEQDNPVVADASSGLIGVDVPQGTNNVRLNRRTMPIETWGLIISLGVSVVWFCLLALSLRTARRTCCPISAGAPTAGPAVNKSQRLD